MTPFRSVFRFAFQHWRPQRLRVASIAGVTILATATDVAMPIFAGRLVDAIASATAGSASPNRNAALQGAMQALGAILSLGAASLLLRHLSFLGIVKMTLRMMTEVAEGAFYRVQRFSTDWHANAFAGSTVRKITRGMHALDLLNDTLLLAFLPSATVLIGTSAVLAAYWPSMALLVLLGSTLYVVGTVTLSLRYVAPAARLANRWDTRVGGVLADAVSCNPVVKSFGAEDREEVRLSGVLGKWRSRTGRTWRRGTVNGSTQNLMLLALRASILSAVIALWWNGRATPGEVTYVLTTFFTIQGYLREVGMHIRNLQRSVNDMEELVDLHAQPLGVPDRPGAKPIAVRRGEVLFDRVSFRYSVHSAALYQDFSVRIAAGERVGLVGRSGSGKTTFVKLVQRLYDLQAGEIRLDGQNIALATQRSLRSRLALVQQEPVLFHRTLTENIAYGRPKASEREILRAAELANAHDFIRRLPRGYATLVGERGVKLSGGERQRIALARAFLADAPILILDEATSSLDSESEQLIQEAMERLMKGRTAIVIAHRLSTVRTMDRILVFERGAIAEEGSHAQLVERPEGIYRRLFEIQAITE